LFTVTTTCIADFDHYVHTKADSYHTAVRPTTYKQWYKRFGKKAETYTYWIQ